MKADDNMYEYYNEDDKKEFLKKYDETTRIYYARTLKKAKTLEEEFNKDIAYFSKEELYRFLWELNASTKRILMVYITIINQYIEYILNENKSCKNNLRLFSTKELDNILHHTSIEKYITEEQLNDIVDNCINPQDACVFQLLYEGIMGNEVSEIRNLKIDDVDFKNKELKLTQTDNFGENTNRKLKISSKLLNLIKEAYEQTEFIKSNGEETEERGKIIILSSPSNYIIRSKKGNENQCIIKTTIIKRFVIIKQLLGYPHLTMNSIYKSGMIKKIKGIKEVTGELTNDDWKQLTKNYGYDNECQWFPLKIELEKYI